MSDSTEDAVAAPSAQRNRSTAVSNAGSPAGPDDSARGDRRLHPRVQSPAAAKPSVGGADSTRSLTWADRLLGCDADRPAARRTSTQIHPIVQRSKIRPA